MLISYNQSYEKIAMGLLSYIPDLKNVSYLQEEMESYIENENKKLYLWRDEHTENIVAIIGLGFDDSILLVRHLSVSPSFRNEGIIYKMLDKLQSLYPDLMINGTLDTAPFLSKWVQRNIDSCSGTDLK